METTPIITNKVWLIHGFNVSDPRGSIGKLEPVLKNAGFQNVEVFDYGWVGPLRLQARNSKVVRELEKVVTSDDILIGHSNGCWISLQVTERRKDGPKNLVFVNPALHPYHAFPNHIKSAFVLHSPGDVAVKAGKWWRRTANTMPWNWRSGSSHQWGEMGRVGYLGRSGKKIENIELPRNFGHSGFFSDEAKMIEIVDRLKSKIIENKSAIVNEPTKEESENQYELSA